MKIQKKSESSADSGSSGSSEGITADNYSKRAITFIHACNGKGFVIRSIAGRNGSAASREPATEAQWLAWMAYFRSKSIPHAFALHQGAATVPAEWPELFDYSAPVSDKDARLPPAPPPITSDERERVQRMLTDVSSRMIPRQPRARQFGVHEMRATPAEHLSELRAEWKENPPLASASLLVKIGVDPLGHGLGNNPLDNGLDDTLP